MYYPYVYDVDSIDDILKTLAENLQKRRLEKGISRKTENGYISQSLLSKTNRSELEKNTAKFGNMNFRFTFASVLIKNGQNFI